MMLFSKLTNTMSSFPVDTRPICNVWTWSIYRIKKSTFNPLCFNIHFAEETVNGSHITVMTAKLQLCTNYTPDLCNVFAIYLVTSWKNDLNYSEKEPSECYIILSRHSKILFPSKPIVRCIGWIDKVYSRCTIWCTIFLIKPFKVHIFLWCTLHQKCLQGTRKNEAHEKLCTRISNSFSPENPC